jgi:hypothetical protein
MLAAAAGSAKPKATFGGKSSKRRRGGGDGDGLLPDDAEAGPSRKKGKGRSAAPTAEDAPDDEDESDATEYQSGVRYLLHQPARAMAADLAQTEDFEEATIDWIAKLEQEWPPIPRLTGETPCYVSPLDNRKYTPLDHNKKGFWAEALER